MSITSAAFMVFCLTVGIVYFAFQKTDYQRYVLLVASAFFIYVSCGKKALLIIAAIALVSWGLALLMEKSPDKKVRSRWLILGFVCTIGILLYFKFFKDTYGILMRIVTRNAGGVYELITPVGISYYSLALYAYLTDVSHKKVKAEKNPLDFMAYVMYFPAIVEGPINMFKKVMPQLKARHTYDWDRMVAGLWRILWGYFKKLVVADRIGIIVNGVLGDENAYGVSIFFALLLYSFQIYADFSGGIDVIMGVSGILDIHLTENFTSPLVSMNVTEYWQRWHKSLGEFMEKYVYYPIVLNRRLMKFSKKISHTYYRKAFSAIVANFLVFIVVGIWHGTGWNYVVYGLYQAVFTSTAVAFKPAYTLTKTRLHIDESCISWRIFTVVRTFVILTFGRALIKSADLAQFGELMGRLSKFDNPHVLFDGTMQTYGVDGKGILVMYIGILLMILFDILHEKRFTFFGWLKEQDIVFRYAAYLVAVFFILVFGIYGGIVNEAAFIYQGF